MHAFLWIFADFYGISEIFANFRGFSQRELGGGRWSWEVGAERWELEVAPYGKLSGSIDQRAGLRFFLGALYLTLRSVPHLVCRVLPIFPEIWIHRSTRRRKVFFSGALYLALKSVPHLVCGAFFYFPIGEPYGKRSGSIDQRAYESADP